MFYLTPPRHISTLPKSEVGQHKRHVRSTPVSDKTADIAGGPVRATSGLLHRSFHRGYRVPGGSRSLGVLIDWPTLFNERSKTLREVFCASAKHLISVLDSHGGFETRRVDREI
jgi:hypothetical protein